MDKERLNKVFCKTDGFCHICHTKLNYSNYGQRDTKGGWEIEHSIPRAKGGTDHLNNLFPACPSCNLAKGTLHTRTARKKHGKARAPLNGKVKRQIQESNTIIGSIVGAGAGLILGGPPLALLGGLIFGAIGSDLSPRT